MNMIKTCLVVKIEEAVERHDRQESLRTNDDKKVISTKQLAWSWVNTSENSMFGLVPVKSKQLKYELLTIFFSGKTYFSCKYEISFQIYDFRVNLPRFVVTLRQAFK